MALIKCPDCGKEVSDVAPMCVNCGRPIAGSPAAPPSPGNQKSPDTPKTRTAFKVVGVILVILAAIVFFNGGNSQKSGQPKSTTSSAQPSQDQTNTVTGSSSEPTSAGGNASQSSDDVAPQQLPKTLPDAIAAYLPLMTDKMDGLSKGAAVLAMWEESKKVTWHDLTDLPRTNAALVMKDSSQERGKLICTSGSIIEISAQDTPFGKVFEGEVNDSAGNGIFRFVAVRSTGDLVEDSFGTFCGVVIGRYDYSNSMNGITHAIQLVGMFKLPQNMK